jgi:hypothetical protein
MVPPIRSWELGSSRACWTLAPSTNVPLREPQSWTSRLPWGVTRTLQWDLGGALVLEHDVGPRSAPEGPGRGADLEVAGTVGARHHEEHGRTLTGRVEAASSSLTVRSNGT